MRPDIRGTVLDDGCSYCTAGVQMQTQGFSFFSFLLLVVTAGKQRQVVDWVMGKALQPAGTDHITVPVRSTGSPGRRRGHEQHLTGTMLSLG